MSAIELDDFVSCVTDMLPFDRVEIIRLRNREMLPVGMVAVGGFYSCEKGVELALYVDNETEIIDESLHSIHELVEEVKLTLLHEGKHKEQHEIRSLIRPVKLRRVNMTDEVDYLSHYDEIDAYGTVDLAVFVKKHGWTKAFSENTSILYRYVSVFGKNSKIVKKLIKKAVLSKIGEKWKIA